MTKSGLPLPTRVHVTAGVGEAPSCSEETRTQNPLHPTAAADRDISDQAYGYPFSQSRSDARENLSVNELQGRGQPCA